MSKVYQCKYCGSKEVAVFKLVNPNTNEIYPTPRFGSEPAQCMDCKTITLLVEKEIDKRDDG